MTLANGIYNKFSLIKLTSKLIKTAMLTTPQTSTDVIVHSIENINIIVGFEVYVFDQWRSGTFAGTLCLRPSDNSMYYINDDSNYLSKPIRIHYY